MKYLAVLMLLAGIFQGGVAMAETLSRAEKMTEAEIAKRKAAIAEVNKANAAAATVNDEIAKAHGMRAESWMEWSSRVRFDGEYILLYHTNHMDLNNIIIGR